MAGPGGLQGCCNRVTRMRQSGPMRAAVCRAFGTDLCVEDLHLCAPGPGEVEVEVAACAICHSDIHYMDGAWGGELPAVYGHEAAGVVVSVGDGVEAPAVGDHVVVTLVRSCGDCFCCRRGLTVLCQATFALDARSPLRDVGGVPVHQGLRTAAFAERVVVHGSQVVVVPPALPLEVASLLACGVITGVGAVVNSSTITAGSEVVVIGTGGVGLNAVQAAALAGSDAVVAVDVSPTKLDAAARFGATHRLDPTVGDAVAEVGEITGGRGASHVLVTVGSKAAIESGFDYLRPGGELVVVGMPATGVVAGFDPCELASKGQRIVGSKMGSTEIARDIPRLVSQYEAGELLLDPLISDRYPLDGINEAVASARAGDAIRNIVVFGDAP